VNGRVALIRDLLAMIAASAVVFAIDLLSPPGLVVSIAYAGLVLFALRPLHARLAVCVAGLATLFVFLALALKGQLSWTLSDALVSGLLSITLTWMIVLLGSARYSVTRAPRARTSSAARPTEAIAQSHADIVKLTEEQRALLDRMHLATQTAGLAVWDRDHVHDTAYLDDSFARLFGLHSAKKGWEDIREVIHPDDMKRVETSRMRALSDSSVPPVGTERFRIVRKTDGALRHIQLHRRLFRDSKGSPERSIGVAWDVTDEVQAAQALMDATEAAQAANRAKSALLANVSHEIRTPMNGIIGMTSLLFDGPLTDAQRECAETIRGSADSLLHVIDDILDFSKIEAGRMEVESLTTDLRRTLEEVRALMAYQATQKQLTLNIDIAEQVTPRVMSDPQRLRQCLINLVGNAIKFTQQGSVSIRVHVVDQGEGHAMTRFEVRDTGIGIEPATMKRLFEPFVQADSSTTRTFGGTGLGLSIVKRLVEMMDGRVGMRSVVGEGSSFWFDLPLIGAPPSDHATAATLTQTINAMPGRTLDVFDARFKGHVLIVEDNAVNQKVAQRILERLGCTVVIANNGAEAIQQYEAAAFDLILMDMQMPVMDGLTATTLIRQREIGKGRTPIIALTANAMSGEYDRCMSVGMDGFLTKPLNIERLRGFLSGFGLRDTTVPVERTMPVTPEVAVATAPCVDRPPPLDLIKLKEVTDGDAEFTNELLSTFFASAEQSLDEMNQTLVQDNRAQLARAAHKLKGAAANIHALEVARVAAQVELDAPDAAKESLAALTAELRTLVVQLADFMRDELSMSIRAA
jgi:PAS domain S-box-containing protein